MIGNHGIWNAYAKGSVLFQDQERLKEIVTSGPYRWPEDVPAGQTAKGLVTALVTLDPLERLGMYGVQEFLTTRCSECRVGKIQSRQYPVCISLVPCYTDNHFFSLLCIEMCTPDLERDGTNSHFRSSKMSLDCKWWNLRWSQNDQRHKSFIAAVLICGYQTSVYLSSCYMQLCDLLMWVWASCRWERMPVWAWAIWMWTWAGGCLLLVRLRAFQVSTHELIWQI